MFVAVLFILLLSMYVHSRLEGTDIFKRKKKLLFDKLGLQTSLVALVYSM